MEQKGNSKTPLEILGYLYGITRDHKVRVVMVTRENDITILSVMGEVGHYYRHTIGSWYRTPWSEAALVFGLTDMFETASGFEETPPLVQGKIDALENLAAKRREEAKREAKNSRRH